MDTISTPIQKPLEDDLVKAAMADTVVQPKPTNEPTRERPVGWRSLSLQARQQFLLDQFNKPGHEASFDGMIYAQSSLSPPPGVRPLKSPYDYIPIHIAALPLVHIPYPRFTGVRRYTNPRTHFLPPRSEAWYQAKQKEIAARPRRKDPRVFGQAAKRMQEVEGKMSKMEFEQCIKELEERRRWLPEEFQDEESMEILRMLESWRDAREEEEENVPGEFFYINPIRYR